MAFGIIAGAIGIGSALLGKRSSDKAAKQSKEIGRLNAQIEGLEAGDRAIARRQRLEQALGSQAVSFAARGLDVASISGQAQSKADIAAFQREEQSDKVRTKIQQKAFREGATARARSIKTQGNLNLLSSIGNFIGGIQ